jgi:hypothetical protein
MSQEKPVKKSSRHNRYNKKRRLEKEQKSTVLDPNIVASIVPIEPTIVSITDDTIFDPNRVYIIDQRLRISFHSYDHFCVDRSSFLDNY